MSKRRNWEIIIYPLRYWQFYIAKPFGKPTEFLTETWIGPFCLRVWTNPLSAGNPFIRRAIILEAME